MADSASKPLSILHLLISVGESSAAYNEHCLASSDKHDIRICTYFKSNISIPKEITVFEGNDSLIGFFRALKEALDEKQYDIIHTHSPHLGLLLLVANVLRSGKLMPSAVYTVHNSYHNYKLRNRLMLYPVVACLRRVVCCSKSSLKSFPRFLRWLAGERIYAVQNGVDIDRADRVIANSPESLQEQPFTMVTVGRLIEIKEPVSVLHAYKQGSNRDSKLVFIGEGHLRAALTAEIAKLGLEKQAELTGLIRREEVFAYLGRADLFVSASRGEGLPVAVLEAMACRCPVILSDIPPHREISGGVDFIPLIRRDDVDGFAEEIRRFQSMSSSERSRLGSRCRRLVEERFSLTSMHDGYEKIYIQLLDENHRMTKPYVLTG